MTPEEIEQLEKTATEPTREEVEPVLRSDILRKYRIDIESDSTIRGDLTRNQQTMNLFLQGTAQFMSALAPMIQIAPDAIEPAVEVYTAFARQFKLGKQAEDALDKLGETARKVGQKIAQPQTDPVAEAKKAETEAKLKQSQQQFEQSEARATREHGEKQAQSQQQFEQSEARAERQHAEKMGEQALQHEQGRSAAREDREADREHDREKHHREMQSKEGDRNFEREKVGLPPQIGGAPFAEQIAQSLASVGEATRDLKSVLEALASDMWAPVEIVRDPQTGKATGSRKVRAPKQESGQSVLPPMQDYDERGMNGNLHQV